MVEGVHDEHGGEGDHDGGVEVGFVDVESYFGNYQKTHRWEISGGLKKPESVL